MAVAGFLIVLLVLTGTDALPRTRLFRGWFGPRGPATTLFALLIANPAARRYRPRLL